MVAGGAGRCSDCEQSAGEGKGGRVEQGKWGGAREGEAKGERVEEAGEGAGKVECRGKAMGEVCGNNHPRQSACAYLQRL